MTASRVVIAAGVALAFAAAAVPGDARHARPVALSQVSEPPDWMVLVQSDDSVEPPTDGKGRPVICRQMWGKAGFFVETSAYRWDGSALEIELRYRVAA